MRAVVYGLGANVGVRAKPRDTISEEQVMEHLNMCCRAAQVSIVKQVNLALLFPRHAIGALLALSSKKVQEWWCQAGTAYSYIHVAKSKLQTLFLRRVRWVLL